MRAFTKTKEKKMKNKKRNFKFYTNPKTGQRTGVTNADSEIEVMQQLKKAIDFCVAEFREKHGDSKEPEIVIDASKRGQFHVQAKNY